MDNYEEDYKSLAVYDRLVERTRYNWEDYHSLPEYFLHSFNNYQKHVQALVGYVRLKVMEQKHISVELHAKIFEVVMNYLQGKPYVAYNLMSESFDLVKDILLRKSEKLIKSPGMKKGKFIFKARVQQVGDASPALRKDMFHIPFEKRHLVSGQRFSIHGVPSVYLGESIYDCYLELGKPDIDRFWVSLFFVPLGSDSKSCSIIDLTFANNQHLLSLLIHQTKKEDVAYFNALDSLVDDILLWPLIMACSIVCKYPTAPFKQEYIVPQILLHLCNDVTGFNGVRYYSTKLDGVNRKKLQSVMVNYALPAQNIKTSGYCQYLASRLSLTKPISRKCISDIPIESKYGYTKTGLPIISGRDENLSNDKNILALDTMTMHFDKLLQNNLGEVAQIEN